MKTDTVASFFGLTIKTAREKSMRTIDEAAALAPMTSSEWYRIEQGSLPNDPVFELLAAGIGTTGDEVRYMLSVSNRLFGS